MTVSYTHLDVYKRQIGMSKLISVIRIGSTVLSSSITTGKTADIICMIEMCIRDRV